MPKKATRPPADWRDYFAVKIHEGLFLLAQLDQLRRAHQIQTGTTRDKQPGLEIEASLVDAYAQARAAVEPLFAQIDQHRRAHKSKAGPAPDKRDRLEIEPSLVEACDQARALLEPPEMLASRLTAPTLASALAAYESAVEEFARVFWSKDAEAFTTRMRQLEASRRMRHYVIDKGLSETAALTEVAHEMNFHDSKSVRRLLRRSKRAGRFPTGKRLWDSFVESAQESRRARESRAKTRA